ncbi:hypothetical protein CAPTEDRAFT_189452 [Capitella teleta]|uniref:Phorbol-ester/DAG-type domain-containing protein n=1 Tax=Capitella teleta TaxID=283909 RepID=R7V7F8_CAPTE|nr:hypothetical protein CAPTEDRAFT_189452 [Capitella teleta]|eukprot:ELU12311.1 hypothetical protein CAPTEDRAFT_189452 [Capitella teleta]
MTSEGPLRERNSRAAERLARHRHANNHQNNTVATCAPPASLQLARSESNGVIQRLTNNLEHYSNVFQDMALPVLLSARARSASGNRSHRRRASSERRGRNGSPFPSDRNSDEDDFVYVESIELSQLDAFVPKESNSHGHRFNVVHLKAPTWCDKCGDFIWGVYKQCLVCQSESSAFQFGSRKGP